MKLTGWTAVLTGLALAGADVFFPGLFLMWTGLGLAAFGVLVLALAHMAHRPPERIARPDAPPAAPAARGPHVAVGETYKALTRFSAGRGRIRIGTASVGALSDDTIVPGETVQVIAVTDSGPRVRRGSPDA